MNRDMKKFLLRFLLFISLPLSILIFLAFTSVFIIGNHYQESYVASLSDKVCRLKSINEPKIILEGDSNLAFGIYSPMIEEAVNMPVVNMGLSSAFGHAYNENMMKYNLNSGDIVIISHFSFADDDGLEHIPTVWQALEYKKEFWKILRLKDYPYMIKEWPEYLWYAFMSWLKGETDYDPPYSRDSFNEYGDIVIRPEESRKTLETLLEELVVKVQDINGTCINRLNELNRYVSEHGATLLVAGYPIISGDFTPPPEEYDKFTRELSERLDCEVISDYRDYFIPHEYFYDTIFHLDEEGAKIRTSQLIKDIKKWQSKHR